MAASWGEKGGQERMRKSFLRLSPCPLAADNVRKNAERYGRISGDFWRAWNWYDYAPKSSANSRRNIQCYLDECHFLALRPARSSLDPI